MVKFQVKGIGEVKDLLKKLGDDTFTRKVILGAQREVLKPVVADMKANLASSTKEGTGNLQASLGVKALRGKSTNTTSLAGMRTGKYKGYHGHLIEAGTQDRKYKRPRLIRFTASDGEEVVARATGSGRVKPTHFASKAISSNSSRVLDNFEQSMVNQLNRTLKRMAKAKV